MGFLNGLPRSSVLSQSLLRNCSGDRLACSAFVRQFVCGNSSDGGLGRSAFVREFVCGNSSDGVFVQSLCLSTFFLVHFDPLLPAVLIASFQQSTSLL